MTSELRVMQPEVRDDGQVYLKEPEPDLVNPKFVVETTGYLVTIIGNDRVAVPIRVPNTVLTRDQMEEVMVRVAMALITVDTIKPGDLIDPEEEP